MTTIVRLNHFEITDICRRYLEGLGYRIEKDPEITVDSVPGEDDREPIHHIVFEAVVDQLPKAIENNVAYIPDSSGS